VSDGHPTFALHWDALDPALLGPALLAGLLVLVTHVPLGIQVLQRGIVFIDLAIAQIAGLGVLIAASLGWETQGWAAQAAAAGAAVLGALGLTWTERRWPEVQEALIGVAFVIASCLGLLLLASNPHGGEHLKDLLVGQILWVSPGQLGAMALLDTLLLMAWWFGRRFGGAGHRAGFYLLFALAVTGSVQLVGVYLVFASLILPALATRSRSGAARLGAAFGVGVAAYALGLLLSALLDLPSGAVIVLAMAALAVALAAIGPRASAQTQTRAPVRLNP
jgi:zinc/manganese transport system permease protein